MLVVLDEAGHERCAELRVAPARVVERKGRHVELALDQRTPLLLRLVQRLTGIHLDLEPDVRLLDLARDDLDHLVAHVALPAGELVRGLQGDVGGLAGDRHGDGRGEQRRTE